MSRPPPANGQFDRHLYGGDDGDTFDRSIAVTEDDAELEAAEALARRQGALKSSITAPSELVRDIREADRENDVDPMAALRPRTIADRESSYQARRLNRVLSPERADPFAAQTPDPSLRTYKDSLKETQLEAERRELLRRKELHEREQAEQQRKRPAAAAGEAPESEPKKPRERASRWDVTPQSDAGAPAPFPLGAGAGAPSASVGAASGERRTRNRWDETPAGATPLPGVGSRWDETPAGGRTRSKWDETPSVLPGMLAATPIGGLGMHTPTPAQVGHMTQEQLAVFRHLDVNERNRPWTEEEIDALLPLQGYKILEPPAGYAPSNVRAPPPSATPVGTPGYQIPLPSLVRASDIPGAAISGDLPPLKPEDYQHFGALLQQKDLEEMTTEEAKERKIMILLLRIKNGTPQMRKHALRSLTDNAREFGAAALFSQILPLLMSPTLEDQERHLLVKVIDRVLFKLDDLVRPYVHKILVVIEPMLIDDDFYARVEGREIISNLCKAAGLATMIAAMRPDLDNAEEDVRNTTARAFAVVASALGIPTLLPFLRAVCNSKKSWMARHTGIKIVQQIALLMGCAVLPHMKNMVEIICKGLTDEQLKVRTITALALAALAEAAFPYGIESFEIVLKTLWKGIRQQKGKVLAAFLKAIGYIVPLMDAEYASYYTREVMIILIREFESPDSEMKKIVLKVVKQCIGTDGVKADYIRAEVLTPFFRHFWIRRMALDRRNYRQLVETTVELANKVGGADIMRRIVDDLKDDSEQYRKMVMETVEQIITNLGASDIDNDLESRLIDGALYAFQEQTSEDTKTMLDGFGCVVNALGTRIKPYLTTICGTITWRLNNKNAKVRQQAADLIARIASVMEKCGEEQLLLHFGRTLFEFLGEEYPDVLGAILGALKSIVNVVGMNRMTPPINELLPRLTPILKNRHERVQENCIDLVGRIADRGSDQVPAREWMRICFELLEMLKAHKKGIRRASVNTFGYIAKAIGPHDVLATLLNNLKVQERQNRVCTTVAIAIVAETCGPFTVLPAVMNEYRVPEMNVQNGVLKSLSFMFEYIGELGRDYIYAVTPLLEDALIDRDLVHRQTAASVVKHITLGVQGLGREDACMHLLNHLFPNIFEASPHVINAVREALDSLRVALGAGVMLSYLMQGLFHPARRVREAYWVIYNNMYIGQLDALTPFYPRVPSDGEHNYERSELDLFL